MTMDPAARIGRRADRLLGLLHQYFAFRKETVIVPPVDTASLVLRDLSAAVRVTIPTIEASFVYFLIVSAAATCNIDARSSHPKVPEPET